MKIKLEQLVIQTKRKIEVIDFSELITFIYGPVGKGKSTFARLIDFCFAGKLENTPAIQQEFVSVKLYLHISKYKCVIERDSTDNSYIRISWFESESNKGSLNAPIQAQQQQLIQNKEIYSFSDMIFYLCNKEPIKVKKSIQDLDSDLIRLSFRDIWRYCYLEQMNMDSSFFRFEHPFKKKKSQDAMRFFTGYHSEQLNSLEIDLNKVIDEQRAKRVAVKQIREFMKQFSLGSENDIGKQLSDTRELLVNEKINKKELLQKRNIDIHPTDSLREKIKTLGDIIIQAKISIDDSIEILDEHRKLHSELITAKIKNDRLERTNILFNDVHFENCPVCGENIIQKKDRDTCELCGQKKGENDIKIKIDNEALRKDINTRIDELFDSIKRREMEISKSNKYLNKLLIEKTRLDNQLQEDLSNYDSGIIEEIRYVDIAIATLEERIISLEKLQSMPQAINKLEEDAGALQGIIDRLKTEIINEKEKMTNADKIIKSIAAEFKRIMISVKFPGVSNEDDVIISPSNWFPEITHNDTTWGFSETGSCGKKTLFNVCYTLAIHSVAKKRNLPVPSILIIDSPTKNISKDENLELVNSLYEEIYKFALENFGNLQFILIDSDYVAPTIELPNIIKRHMAGTENAPSLISYYDGP